MTTSATRTRVEEGKELGGVEHVVLVDERGCPSATIPKPDAHSSTTPLHLAFSCHVVRADGQVLLTQRAHHKPTWPGVWTNACCGHPQLGESFREAVTRRLGEELGARPVRLALAVGDFAYRAVMAGGTVEHELCPVVVVEIDDEPLRPDAAEVADHRWVPWEELVRRAAAEPASLSPWSVAQVAELAALSPSPWSWPEGPAATMLDLPVGLGRPLAAGPLRARTNGNALDPVAAPVRAVLSRFLADKVAALVAVDVGLGEVADEVRLLVEAGGKLLRPAFVHWGHRAAGGDADEAVMGPAAALELLHTFALLHDDVMDRSERRRGRPAAHVALAARHRDGNRLGDADWFGASGA
ncbi:MAG: isopentenyl-diphosphate Delta-isomerase, partial [Acidimicrobiia bacterium]|nr:isopentenyl-diphosphate Delta-isomerase [Acidimicrobiia bacterium]